MRSTPLLILLASFTLTACPFEPDEDSGDLPEGDLDAHPGQKPDEHGAGEEVGEEAQTRDASEEQEDRHQDGVEQQVAEATDLAGQRGLKRVRKVLLGAAG